MPDTQQSDFEVQAAIQQMQAAANNVAVRLVTSASVRARYIVEVREMSDALWGAYKAGELSAANAAKAANEARNTILEMARNNDLDFGRAYARSLKRSGLELDQVILYIMNKKNGFKERYAGKLFKDLTSAQQTEIYEEVIQSAGRNRASITRGISRLRWAARGLWVATAAIAIYNVGTSQTPWWQSGREAANLGGGLVGSMAGGAAMGAAAGVWGGPIGVGVGVIVGGILGALLADHAYVQAAGTADPRTRDFVSRFTSLWTGVDESGMAEALVNEHPNRLDFVYQVIQALDADYTTDSDDIAYEYVMRVKTRPALAQAVKANAALRDALVGAMSSGITTASETQAISWLQAR
jgi:hypothetical protein